jgi:asparagine synthase
MKATAPRLSSLEIATGMVFGVLPGELPDPDGLTPLRTLEDVIRPALLREPCLVSFSGGRDSSAVLAVATVLARREGLPLPIPATNVFPAERETDETGWQERVVRHLGLTDWLRIEHTVELDALGTYAQRLLGRHGLVWPFNAHFHAPLLEAAAGGSLLTGIGGDELFGAAQRNRAALVATRRARPEARDLLRLGLACAPASIRRAVLAWRQPVSLPWLRREAQERLSDVLADWMAQAPRTLTRRLAWVRMSRYLEVATNGLGRAAEDEDVLLVHPLLAPKLWAEVGRVAQPMGFSGRTEGMRRLFAAVLPDAICGRAGKARFDGAFWTAQARTHARSWTGGGVPAEWVDEQALATHWRTGRPLANSFTLLQASWLASVQSVDQPVHRVIG